MLGKCIPPPFESLSMHGISKKDANLRTSFEDVLNIQNDTEISEILNKISKNYYINPLEVKITGTVLEWHIKKDKKVDTFNNIADILKEYIETCVKALKYPDTAKEILYTISISKNKLLKKDNIIEIISRQNENKKVKTTLKELEQSKLVKNADIGYELINDYFKKHIINYLGTELVPIQRDNISFFISNYKKNSIRQINKSKKFKFFAYASFALTIVCRLFYKIIDISSVLQNTSIDFFNNKYILIFISHGLWVYYVCRFCERFFYPIAQGILRKSIVFLTVIMACFSMLFGAYYQEFWLVFIAIGGAFISLNMLLLSNSYSNKGLKDRFRSMFKETFANMLAVSLFGFLIEPVIIANENPMQMYANFLVFIVITYFAIQSISWHTSNNAIAKFLGLVKRSII